MSFILSATHLRRICEISAFPVPKNELVFFGLRGCTPIDPLTHSFAASHELETVVVNYVNPMCVVGQWQPGSNDLAVFPGSTVPQRSLVESAKKRNGEGVNQLLTGCYYFVKGTHRADSPSGHKAFRQDGSRAYRRTGDDLDYDGDDRVEWGNPGDNLHAAWCGCPLGQHSSAGCQVVVGYPTTLNGSREESGAWKMFRSNAYAQTQTRFTYLLIDSWEAQRVAKAAAGTSTPAILRFGSRSALVKQVQTRLKALGYFAETPDGDFGVNTSKGLYGFQTATFGQTEADGVVGPNTAQALGISPWPEV